MIHFSDEMTDAELLKLFIEEHNLSAEVASTLLGMLEESDEHAG